MNQTNKDKVVAVNTIDENTQNSIAEINDVNNVIKEAALTKKKRRIVGLFGLALLLILFVIVVVRYADSNDNYAKGTVEFCDAYTNRVIDNRNIKKAEAEQDEYGDWYVEIHFTKQGRELFRDATKRILKYKESDRIINIFVDYELVASPTINEIIDLDSVAILGEFSKAQAEQLSDMINNENKENTREKLMTDIGTNINWQLSPEEITVEAGEVFQINYSPAYGFSTIRPPLQTQEVIDGEFVWSSELNDVHNYDYVSDDIETDLPGIETLVINKIGTYFISVRWPLGGQSNTCKVNVVENKERIIEEKKKTEEIQTEEKVSVKESINKDKESQIIVKNQLPAEFKFMSSSGKWYSSCKVHKVDVIQKNGSVLIELLCEKTFDEKMGASAECYFVWKLYDDQNIVVDSGHVSKYNISVNERFTETICIFKDLAPKKYILEFSELQL